MEQTRFGIRSSFQCHFHNCHVVVVIVIIIIIALAVVVVFGEAFCLPPTDRKLLNIWSRRRVADGAEEEGTGSLGNLYLKAQMQINGPSLEIATGLGSVSINIYPGMWIVDWGCG